MVHLRDVHGQAPCSSPEPRAEAGGQDFAIVAAHLQCVNCSHPCRMCFFSPWRPDAETWESLGASQLISISFESSFVSILPPCLFSYFFHVGVFPKAPRCKSIITAKPCTLSWGKTTFLDKSPSETTHRRLLQLEFIFHAQQAAA